MQYKSYLAKYNKTVVQRPLNWLEGYNVSDKVTMGVVDVVFEKTSGTNYGFDDGTVNDNPVPSSADPENLPQKYSWINVGTGGLKTDVSVKITPASLAKHVYFTVVGSNFAISKTQATLSPEILTITGGAQGSSAYILSKLGSATGANAERLNVGVYNNVAIQRSLINIRVTSGSHPNTTVQSPSAITPAQFQSDANSFLRQGVVTLILSGTNTGTITDHNGDGHLTYDTTVAGGGQEWADVVSIVNALGPRTDPVLHIKDSICVLFSGGRVSHVTGLHYGKYICVTDSSSNINATLAHELLHRLGLKDVGPQNSNAKNIMYYMSDPNTHFIGVFKVESVQTGTGSPNSPKTYERQWEAIVR